MKRRVTAGHAVGARLFGRVGEAEPLAPEWVGWSGKVTHPDSPQGGGGPGFFAPTGGSEREEDPKPWQPGRLDQVDNLPKQAPRAPNPPPPTRPRSLGTLKEVQQDNVDVKIEGEVLADGSGGPSNGAETNFEIPSASSPGFEHSNGKITKFTGKFTWTGKLTIQTQYGTNATARDLSCYGRGTTSDDIRNGDITLGFHESRHHADYVAFLKDNPLPDPPPFTVPVKKADHEKAVKKFFQEFDAYSKRMKQSSFNDTDEVGRRKSEVPSKGCFPHRV